MAFPIFFRRLFANEGAGPLLRGDILPFGSTAGTVCQGNDTRFDHAAQMEAVVDAWRRTWIGVPRWWRSTVCPANHVWANGDLVLFEDWPELKEVYDEAGFEGMLLAADADSTTMAASLGKWREHPNGLGLFTPLLSGQFFRGWGTTADGEAGGWHRDEIRNITGKLNHIFSSSDAQTFQEGAFVLDSAHQPYRGNQVAHSGMNMWISFSAERVVATGPENVPQHIRQPLIIYLGVPR